MSPTQRPTFSWRVIGGGGGFSYLLASGGASGSINFDFTTGVLPGAITFTRASIGTYTNAAGTLITASSNVARFNYVSGVSCLLIERAATNLLLGSNDFSYAYGGFNGAVVTPAQFVSPDGSNNGWSVTSGTGSGGVIQNFNYSNVPYTLSVWMKLITGAPNVQLIIAAVGVATPSATSTITRFFGTGTAAAGSNTTIIQINSASGTTHGVYGSQLETGSIPTSYIPTTTSQATRAADAATFTVPSDINLLTYTFDDNSTQLVSVSAGSYTIPVTLNRPNIKSIVGSA